MIKINVDGAINSLAGVGGAGGVARSDSAFLGAWSKSYEGVSDPLIMEALSLRDCVRFAQLRGFRKVTIETDCLEVVNLWHSREASRSVIAPLLDEIGELSFSFSVFIIQHVIRSANFPAHLCAKFACTIRGTESWLDSISPVVSLCWARLVRQPRPEQII